MPTVNEQLKTDLPKIKPGSIVRVHQKIEENGKTRTQIFEGIIIALKHGTGISGTMTVRKESFGVGVERVFPLHSPNIAKIEIVENKKVRRAKLYYLRELTGKRARLKKKLDFIPKVKEESAIIDETVKGQ